MSGADTPVRARPTPSASGSLDCSEEAQRWRKLALARLLEKMYSGVESLGDRGRSVNYHSLDDLQRLVNNLRQEIALCDNTPGADTGGRRIFTIPYNKWN
jgi:hypothetical protein